MNTKAFFPCGGGSNLMLETGRENQIFVYQMDRLCKISGIPAPLCLCGCVVGGFMGWLGVMVEWMVGGFMEWVGVWLEGSCGGWVVRWLVGVFVRGVGVVCWAG